MIKDSIFLVDVSNQIPSTLRRVACRVKVLQLIGKTLARIPWGGELGLGIQPGYEALSDIWMETRIKIAMINME